MSRIVRVYVPATALAAFLAPWAIWGWRLPEPPVQTSATQPVGVLVLLLFAWAVVWWMLAVDFVFGVFRLWLTQWTAVLPTRLGVVVTYAGMGLLVGRSWAEVLPAGPGLGSEYGGASMALGALIGFVCGVIAARLIQDDQPGQVDEVNYQAIWAGTATPPTPLPDPDLQGAAERLKAAKN